MVDISGDAVSLRQVWSSFGHRAAALSGSAIALTSLLLHVPVHVACLRGAIAWATVLSVVHASAWLTERTAPPEVDGTDGTDETDETVRDGTQEAGFAQQRAEAN